MWLAALAWGASQVAVLLTGREAPQYRAALAFQMRIADTIADALGYQGEHFRLVDATALDELRGWTPALGVRIPATVRADRGKAHDRGARVRAPGRACAGAASR